MTIDSVDFMRRVAADVRAEFGDFVTIDARGPVGTVDYQVTFTPIRPEAARIEWHVISDTFTISVSPRLEWQSEEWITYGGDDAVDRELSQRWAEDVIWRIIESGARYLRTKSLLPGFMNCTYVMVGDEAFDRPHDVLESWSSWRKQRDHGRPV